MSSIRCGVGSLPWEYASTQRRRPPGSSGASRAPSDAAGARRCPGSSSGRSIPALSNALAAKLPAGVAVVSATNGKTTTSAMLARILGSRYRLAWNNSGANLASGVASTLLSTPDADLGLLEVDEFALPEMIQRVQSAGRLARQPLSRPARPLRRARAHRGAVAGRRGDAPSHLDARRERRRSARRRSRGRAGRCAALRRRRSTARPARAAARGRLEVLRPLRRALRLRRGLRRPPRRLPLPELRAQPAAARHRRTLDRPPGARRVGVRSRHAGRHGAGDAAAARSLQRLQRPRRCRHGARPRRVARRDRRRARAPSRRRSAGSSGSRQATSRS